MAPFMGGTSCKLWRLMAACTPRVRLTPARLDALGWDISAADAPASRTRRPRRWSPDVGCVGGEDLLRLRVVHRVFARVAARRLGATLLAGLSLTGASGCTAMTYLNSQDFRRRPSRSADGSPSFLSIDDSCGLGSQAASSAHGRRAAPLRAFRPPHQQGALTPGRRGPLDFTGVAHRGVAAALVGVQ